MKIIQKGVRPKRYPWIGKARCSSCGTVVELEEDDVGAVKEWDSDQREGISVRIACPVCLEERRLHVLGTGANSSYYDR